MIYIQACLHPRQQQLRCIIYTVTQLSNIVWPINFPARTMFVKNVKFTTFETISRISTPMQGMLGLILMHNIVVMVVILYTVIKCINFVTKLVMYTLEFRLQGTKINGDNNT